ncbi:MAG: AAA family ATPase [Xanthomonadaceae bacterium]|nr:AAA family ATPase [Xanthomonadaceae bacterium]
MYEHFYGLEERPFSITPDPRFVFLSQRHQDALAHLLYGIGRGGSGGFVQLTGEVGTGKTTLCRLVLEQVPEYTRIALILNPMLEPRELLRAICRELEVEPEDGDTGLESLGQCLNQRLLEIHAAGERAVLIIDEAQNMSRETLEQVRLLTNLETATDKLLQIILLGQPELRELLSRPSLRQLAQRITARYHLAPLSRNETADYVRHRIRIAGAPRCPFTVMGLRSLHQVSGGVPRLINIIADRALMAGYAREAERIGARLVRRAASEVVVGDEAGGTRRLTTVLSSVAVLVILAVSGSMIWSLSSVQREPTPVAQQPLWQQMLASASQATAWREVAALWPGFGTADVAEACLEGQALRNSQVLACHRLRGSWALIRRLNQPVVVRLTEPPDGYVLALAVEAAQVQLRQSGQDFRVPITHLDSRWLGDFLVVWPDGGQVWRRGDQNAAIGALKQLAARDTRKPWDGPIDDLYSTAFEVWIRDFQDRNGLTRDGMAGPVTRLFLDTLASEPAVVDPS